MANTAKNFIKQAESWLGCKESDGSHRKIIDTYNTLRPLPRGYPVKYTDSWCATFVSAVAVKTNCTDIVPPECSCPKMIGLFQSKGCWDENDNRVPNPGDVIFYDWEDSGSGDNHGSADHVGIVTKVVGNEITVIEGNYHDSVAYRHIKVGGRYIRGYGVPKFTAEVTPTPTGRWMQDKRGWYYIENGKRKTNCWIKDSKDWCFLDDKGYVLTNAWVKDSTGWCFVKDDGRILRDGYASDSRGQHYVDSTGHMK